MNKVKIFATLLRVKGLFILFLLSFNIMVSATLVEKLNEICANVRQMVPVTALLMFITAGLIYAAGQVMGAETRARANVWSTAMLVGGIIGLILAASAPYLLQTFAQASIGGEGSLDISSATCTT